MKYKYNLLYFFVVVLVFCGCSKQNVKSYQVSSIYGTWRLYKVIKAGITVDTDGKKGQYIFQRGGIIQTVVNETRYIGRWRLEGEIIHARWRSMGYQEKQKIVVLTKNRLVLQSSDGTLVSHFKRVD